MRQTLVLFVAIAIILTACGPQTSRVATVPPTTTSILTLTQILTPTPTYTPTIIPTPIGGGGGKIVFVSERDGNPEIYVINSDRSQQTRLTDNYYDDTDPHWSPDRKHIAFISVRGTLSNIHREIYIMNADGSNQTRLSDTSKFDWGPNQPQWSPDGKKILFYSFGYDESLEKDVSEIYTINVDGSELTRLTYHNSAVVSPNWSLDGRKIAFGLLDSGTSNIYVINADGSEETRLTFNDRYNIGPEWSPDGNTIAYVSNFPDSYSDIYTIKADGTNDTQITHDDYSNVLSEWSPDGSRLVYHYDNGESDNICFVDVDSRISDCLKNLKQGTDPKWSPDGHKIAFISNRNGELEIFIMNVDGNEQTRLTESTTNETWIWRFEWQP